jgi:hypothetical protein
MIYLIIFLVVVGVLATYDEIRDLFWGLIQSIFLALSWIVVMLFKGIVVLLPYVVLLYLLIMLFSK